MPGRWKNRAFCCTRLTPLQNLKMAARAHIQGPREHFCFLTLTRQPFHLFLLHLLMTVFFRIPWLGRYHTKDYSKFRKAFSEFECY